MSRDKTRRVGWHALAFVFAAVALGCSSRTATAPAPCNEDPFQCPPGQTCWPVDLSRYGCVPSGSGALGAACQLTANVATCGADLGCFGFATAGGVSASTCVPYCDEAHGCPSGQECAIATLAGSPLLATRVCAPVEPPMDAGGSPDAVAE